MKALIQKMFKPRPDIAAPEISLSEERGVRSLHFGSIWVQGAMRIADPFRLELDYTRELFAGLLFVPQPKQIVLLGMGAGSATKFAWAQFPKARITTVEVASAVIACAHTHFAVPRVSSRFAIECAEAEAWVRTHPESCDVMIADLYDTDAQGPVCDSAAFYAACRAALTHPTRAGVLAVNLFGRHRSYGSNISRMRKAFDGRVLTLPPSDRGNVIALALTGPRELSEGTDAATLRARAAQLRAAHGLEFPRFYRGLREQLAAV